MGAVRLTHNGELIMKDMERVQRAVRFEFHAEIRSELTAAYGDDLPVYQIRAIR